MKCVVSSCSSSSLSNEKKEQDRELCLLSAHIEKNRLLEKTKRRRRICRNQQTLLKCVFCVWSLVSKPICFAYIVVIAHDFLVVCPVAGCCDGLTGRPVQVLVAVVQGGGGIWK